MYRNIRGRISGALVLLLSLAAALGAGPLGAEELPVAQQGTPVSAGDGQGFWEDLELVAAQAVPHAPADGVRLVGVPTEKDAEGLKKDTLFFISYQAASLGLIYLAPESVSNWTQEDKDNVSFSKWWDNVSDPQWDTDDWWINYGLHPYWGAAYFVRARMRGYNSTESFWYSFALSSMYEFGVEAIFEEPSIQDIFVTPAFGAVLGSAFMNVREDIYEKYNAGQDLSRWDRTVLGLTDPLGWLNGKFARLFGVDSQMSLTPFRGPAPGKPQGTVEATGDDYYGVRFAMRW